MLNKPEVAQEFAEKRAMRFVFDFPATHNHRTEIVPKPAGFAFISLW